MFERANEEKEEIKAMLSKDLKRHKKQSTMREREKERERAWVEGT